MALARISLTMSERDTLGEINDLKEQGTPKDLRRIIEIANTTTSPRVRNAAAIAMADLHIEGAEEVLIGLLRRPDTKTHRGTLLYALSEINGCLPIPLVVSLLFEENYEGREETLVMIGKKHISGTMSQWEDALTALQSL